MLRYLTPILLALLVSSAAYAAAVTLASNNIDQLGRGEGNVVNYYVRVLSASVTVNSNQITGGSVMIASTVSRTYTVTITVSTSAGTQTYTTMVSLSPTPTTISFTITPLSYTAPGATISVRADPV
jgi:P pilus assembly chaperone PapD